MPIPRNAFAALLLAAFAPLSAGQAHDHASHAQHAMHAASPAPDTRAPVRFPPELREHTLANMRDHLLALQEIQFSLARQEYDMAGEIAEQRLGMSSLSLHGAHDVAKFMPQGMQDAGTAMHRGASRFALAAREAGATGDLKPPLAALAEVTAACVACHAGYGFK
jgi:hypothetical protein